MLWEKTVKKKQKLTEKGKSKDSGREDSVGSTRGNLTHCQGIKPGTEGHNAGRHCHEDIRKYFAGE